MTIPTSCDFCDKSERMSFGILFYFHCGVVYNYLNCLRCMCHSFFVIQWPIDTHLFGNCNIFNNSTVGILKGYGNINQVCLIRKDI
jgi:hypothetical protein